MKKLPSRKHIQANIKKYRRLLDEYSSGNYDQTQTIEETLRGKKLYSEEIASLDPRMCPENRHLWLQLLVYRKKKSAQLRRSWLLTDLETAKLLSSHCTYCGFKGEINQMGLDRVENDIGYINTNVVPCCYKCNMAKRNLSVYEFKEWIKKAYHFQNS